MKLTSKERIMRLFQNKEVDRPALKLWGAGPVGSYSLLNPAYEPVAELAAKISDLFVTVPFSWDIFCGANKKKYFETWTVPTSDPLWNDVHRVYHTPKGDLHAIERTSTVGEPSYTMEHWVKEPEDIERMLSMEYEPEPFDRKNYDAMVKCVGDRGVVMMGLPHAGYEALQCAMGSETLAYFSVDCREELLQAMDIYSERVRAYVEQIFAAGIHAPYAWYGPEVFLPPLMGPRDFRDFVHGQDKPLCDLIHEHGDYVWVHSHGKVADFIDAFIDMGVDILNPLEPPKNGDIHLGNIIKKYGNRIGWEGNIEIQELLQSSPERIRGLIDECVELGSTSGRFVLCPSAGFNEYPNPSREYIENLLLYLQYGYEAVERCRIDG